MKRIFFLSVVLIILALMLTGCEKPEPPAPPAVFYTLTTIINGKGSVNPDKLSGIIPGSSITVKFIPEPGHSFYSAKENGVKIENLQPSASEVPYTVQNINKNSVLDVVFVEDDILLFSVKSINEKPWMLTRVGVYKAEGDVFLRNWYLTQAEKTDRYYFIYPSMDTFVYEEDGGIRRGNWSLKQRVVQFDSQSGVISILNNNMFVYEAKPIWSQADNCYVFASYTFERK